MNFRLPDGMLLGVASAAAQIEGGELNSSWNDWYHKGNIKDGSDPAASDHWDRWQEDTDLMASMGIQVCRLGLEWARIMPEPDRVDEDAVAHYRQELERMREKGIRPLLTLHHFANPMWFEKKGAFEKRENLEDFLRFVQLAAERFGDLVSEYITINEPNVYAVNGYTFGIWPPGKRSVPLTISVMSNLAYCHIRAYQIIHKTRLEMGYSDTMVGFANHLRVFDPQNPRNLWHRGCARLTDRMFQGALSRALTLGEFRWPIRNIGRLPRGEYADFHGVNYYTRSTVSGVGDGVRANSPRNDLDWEIYPEGLVLCARPLVEMLNRPVWVTENGTCDNQDRFRARYICEHLQAMAESDLPFVRYYHWCFCDNFEWIEGNSARFGLVKVDFDAARARSIKRSGEFFAAVIRNGGVSEELYDTYVRAEEYEIR